MYISFFNSITETCQSDAFHCDIALCIPKRLKCDNFQHCQDGTDETLCEAGDFNSCQDAWNAGFRQTGYYVIGKQIEKFKDCYR